MQVQLMMEILVKLVLPEIVEYANLLGRLLM